MFEPTVVDVLQREAEENYCAMNGGKPADCDALKWSPSQLSKWCGRSLTWYWKAISIALSSESGTVNQEGQLVGAFTWSPADPLLDGLSWVLPLNPYQYKGLSHDPGNWIEVLLLAHIYVHLAAIPCCNCRVRLTQWCNVQASMYTMIRYTVTELVSYVNVLRKVFHSSSLWPINDAKLNFQILHRHPIRGQVKWSSMQRVCTSLQQCGSWNWSLYPWPDVQSVLRVSAKLWLSDTALAWLLKVAVHLKSPALFQTSWCCNKLNTCMHYQTLEFYTEMHPKQAICNHWWHNCLQTQVVV